MSETKQSKEDFLRHVQYHARTLGQREMYLKEKRDKYRVTLDKDLNTIYEEIMYHETKMLEAAVSLSKRCQDKLEQK